MAMPNLPPLIMGGAGWSYQLTHDPDADSVLDIVEAAFSQGVRAIDTSPYYEPSEELLGKALSHPNILSQYRRKDFFIMTKCGRIAADHFDYSPDWIKKSLTRSLDRFGTMYLDVVFCHDVEFVTVEEAVAAVATLFELVDQGRIKFAGISGYDLEAMIRVADAVRERLGRPVDVVQNWAQLSLQNTRLESYGFAALRKAGVRAVCNASPLACGLLRSGGVPVGKLGDWHPAPSGLRAAARQASQWVAEQGDSLASVSLRFAISQAAQSTYDTFQVSTITGISTKSDLQENIAAAAQVLGLPVDIEDRISHSSLSGRTALNMARVEADRVLCDGVRSILEDYIDYALSKPPSAKGSDLRAPIDSITEDSNDVPSRLYHSGSGNTPAQGTR
ncbi:D-arabinose 1-dehydrogenase [Cyphellophora attinorum]|uniref:D-arabinose 1-dehydrogenase n=1 Tax=Cyphellophora attinorum TaxID=1664694 RepID=A0A0N1H1G9_9EURO|nr:D-arabinose 1-dehydrogenase [Phialophora attinorum]KPI34624.1 D-arabinose 1-dehydrogenase [Phialophora attinorum]